MHNCSLCTTITAQQDADFGAQHVNSIELLAMRSAEDASGYYQCEASVQLAAGSS